MEEDIPESFQENHVNDSYDELAQGAELEPTKRGRGRPKGAKNKPKVQQPPSESENEELPIKKKVIPKKKTKPPPEYEEEEPPKVVMKEPKPPPEYEEEGKQNKSVPKKKSKPPPPDPEEEEPPKQKKKAPKKPPQSDSEEERPPPPKSKKANFTLDVEFDEPKRKAPVRIKRPVAAARPLMHLVAEAAQQHVVREKDRRRNFYESFLPL